ncbi:MAG: ATP-binding protein [Candidatus Binatia bacterium]
MNGKVLTDELAILNLRLVREIKRGHRRYRRARSNVLLRFHLDECDLIKFLDEALPKDKPQEEESCTDERLEKELTELRTRIAELETNLSRERETASSDPGTASLSFLALSLPLNRFEQFCLIVCLAPEINPNYGKVYAYLQDEFNKRHPTVDLVLRLFSREEEEYPSNRVSLDTTATLLSNRLIKFGEDADTKVPLTARTLMLDDRIAAYLLGFSRCDHYLDNWVEVIAPSKNPQSPSRDKSTADETAEEPTATASDVPPHDSQVEAEYYRERAKLQERTSILAASCFSESGMGHRAIIHFYGQDGASHRSVAQYACNELGRDLLVADLQRLVGGLVPQRGEALWRLAREAFLRDAVIYVENIDELLQDDRSTEFNLFFDAIECFSRLTFLSGHAPWRGPSPVQGQRFVSRECPVPSARVRATLWRDALASRNFAITEKQCEELASTFILTESQIRNAVRAAENELDWEGQSEKIDAIDILRKACRNQATVNLGYLAQRIEPTFKRRDIILPENQLEQIDEMVSHVKNSGCVIEKWGFAKKLPYGRGVTALFEGPSGSGKTMAAEIIAHELGVDLYKIDLSTVVSKYIGETEKNLSRIFAEARATNCALFFDEGDALFGKRSADVKDAHDRYANIEVAYLLQQIENHSGVVILATNLKQNLDEAFIRRMRFIIHFPFPNEDDRENIWRKVFPEKKEDGTPLLSKEVGSHYPWLARRLKITGGNIKNIALRAAYWAAKREQPADVITMIDIVEAAKRELEKIGRVYTEEDFYPWVKRKTVKQEAA